jgi:uncharacterized membrane protein YedE/YeeE
VRNPARGSNSVWLDLDALAKMALAPGVLSPYFTPSALAAALAGGALLGLATVAKLALNGNILGISGIVSGCVKPSIPTSDLSWRMCFVLGLPAAGIILRCTGVDAFEPLPVSVASAARLACAGLLVGVGTSLGNGCTSGHGISGLSRFSVRSLAATATFMTTGAVSASAFGTASWLSTANSESDCISNVSQSVKQVATISGVSCASFATAVLLLIMAVPRICSADQARLMLETASGTTTGLALGISAMSKPSKVAGFLDLSRGVDHWDPTLAFVMAGALCVTIPCYQLWLKGGNPRWKDSFGLPTNTKVDKRLLVGAATFGTGWGLAGICPGPSFVGTFGSTSAKACVPWATFLAGLFVGWWLTPRMTRGRVGTHDTVRAKEFPSHDRIKIA